MKHTLKVTIILILIFLLSQLTGLLIISNYIDIEQTSEQGRTVINKAADNISGFKTPEVEREYEQNSWIVILAAILLGTVLVLLIIKFNLHNTWKFWFMFSIGITLFRALVLFVNWLLTMIGIPGPRNIFYFSFLEFTLTISGLVTLVVVIILTYYKIVKKNFIVHNITEIFIYGGLASFIVPVVWVEAAIVLLIGISIYDMIAVWKTKHMVVMAQFQTQNKLFAGLMMPYNKETGDIGLPKHLKEKDIKHAVAKKTPKADKPSKKDEYFESDIKTAILGGGDIAFPLIFAGAVMKAYNSWLAALIIVATTTLALFLLLTYGKKDKFYPAMPFISAGCLLGYLIVLII